MKLHLIALLALSGRSDPHPDWHAESEASMSGTQSAGFEQMITQCEDLPFIVKSTTDTAEEIEQVKHYMTLHDTKLLRSPKKIHCPLW